MKMKGAGKTPLKSMTIAALYKASPAMPAKPSTLGRTKQKYERIIASPDATKKLKISLSTSTNTAPATALAKNKRIISNSVKAGLTYRLCTNTEAITIAQPTETNASPRSNFNPFTKLQKLRLG